MDTVPAQKKRESIPRRFSRSGAAGILPVFVPLLVAFSAPAALLFSEDFDDAVLRDPVSETDPSPGILDWNTPEDSTLGWSRGADDVSGGATEWLGWSFTTPAFWISVSGNQNRSDVFAPSTSNVIAVADSDEAEDGGSTPTDGYNAYLRTPTIDVTGYDLTRMVLSFDSNFRAEEDESSRVLVILDGGAPIAVSVPDQGLTLTPMTIGYADLPGAPATASSLVIEFAHENADNNWWWAIDNIRLTALLIGETNAPPVVAGQPAGPSPVDTGALSTYWFSASDPDGDPVQLEIDWGDGNLSSSPFVPPGDPAPLEHAWGNPGTYAVRARAIDVNRAMSSWQVIQSVTVVGDPQVTLVTPPYLQNLRTDGIVVMCESAEDVDLAVEYGLDESYGATGSLSRVASGGGTFFHRVALTGLQPGTHYHYRVITPGAGTPIGDSAGFRTAPVTEEDFSFSVWSDSQGSNHGAWSLDPLEPTISMMQHMVASGVAFGLTAGDLAENGGSYADTRSYYLDRVATHLGTAVPWFAAWGNHDTGNPSAPLRLASDMPSRYRAGFSPGHGSYAFTYANCFFVCIDHFQQGDITSGWLETQLASPEAQQARFRFLAIHVPPYCERWIDGSDSLRTHLVPLLEQYNVDCCFSGHTHEYERGEQNHVHYVVTGGGSWLDHPEVVVRDWEHMIVGGAHDVPGTWASQSAPGVLGPEQPIVGGLFNEYALVTVRENFLLLEAQGFNADGSHIGVLDAFHIGTDPGPDSDGDGMRDPFETTYQLNPHDPADAALDPDHDGFSNLEESIVRTNPKDADDFFQLKSIRLVPFQVSLQTVSGVTYTVETSQPEHPSPWTPFSPPHHGDGRIATWTLDPIESGTLIRATAAP